MESRVIPVIYHPRDIFKNEYYNFISKGGSKGLLAEFFPLPDDLLASCDV